MSTNPLVPPRPKEGGGFYTTSSYFPESNSRDYMNPEGEEHVETLFFTSEHVDTSRRNSHSWHGWTEEAYLNDANAGGAVRNVLLSGSYGEFRQVRVDTEVNAETISTSWGARVGENLVVGNAASIAGYLQVGTESALIPGAAERGQEITASKAEYNNQENVRVVVGGKTVTEDLYVANDSEFGGDVTAENLTARDSITAPEADITDASLGTLTVVSQSEFKDNATFRKNVYVDGNLYVTGSETHINVDELYIKDRSITLASGSEEAEQAHGAGLIIQTHVPPTEGEDSETDVEFTYDALSDMMVLNRGLNVDNQIIAPFGHFDNLSVDTSASVGNLTVDQLVVTAFTASTFEIVSASIPDLTGSHASITDLTASQIYAPVISGSFTGDGSSLTGITIENISEYTTFTASFALSEDNGWQVTMSHNLGTENVIVDLYRTNGVGDFPYKVGYPVEILDTSSIGISLDNVATESIEGYAVVAKAGHVVSGNPEALFNSYSVHRGTNGVWYANKYVADNIIAGTASVSEYIDASRIGNLNSGEQYYRDYYDDPVWGSYTEYTDFGIVSVVRSGSQEDSVAITASLLDSDGLHLSGALYTNQAFNTSDIRYKDNIQAVPNALESLNSIAGVKFTWKNTEKQDIGVIAQEVQTIYPELTKLVKNLDGEDQLTVNYNGLVGVLIEAVKELSKKVSELEKQVNKQ